jgi:hypothetical protein
MVESGLTGKAAGSRIQGKNHKHTCLNPVLSAGIREEPRHPDMPLKEAILTGFRIQGKTKSALT